MDALERCALRPLREEDLALVLGWRNHPAIRAGMLTRHEITMAEHRAWFERASADASRRLLVALDGDVPIGFVHFTNANPGDVADWGFYAAPGAPRGSGTRLCASALDMAFGDFGVHKVCGQVLEFNQASLRLHDRLGFRREGVLRAHHRIGERYHDVICFGILQEEWP